MKDLVREQYDSLYSSKEEMMYSDGEPLKDVREIRDYIEGGSVLDIGGGEGRNALYLAELSFAVTVWDFSSVGLEKLQKFAKEKSLKIETHIVDIAEENIQGGFDAVVNSFVLFHLYKVRAEEVIKESQTCTRKGGVHVLATFMNQGDMYERNKNSGRFYPSESDIRDLYADWDIKILRTRETTTLAKDKNRGPLKNHMISLIAVKK